MPYNKLLKRVFNGVSENQNQTNYLPINDSAPVVQLAELLAAMWEVVSLIPAGPTLRVLKKTEEKLLPL